jgi:hypothetical protein
MAMGGLFAFPVPQVSQDNSFWQEIKKIETPDKKKMNDVIIDFILKN